MSRLKINVAANYAGAGWSALLALALVPVYLHLLGAEAYGLVGFFIALKATLGVLDLGLSTSVYREVAHRAVRPYPENNVGTFVRTIEVIYWIIGGALGLAVIAAANVVVVNWFKLAQLAEEAVVLATVVFGFTLIVSWPVALYRGVLRGLERHVAYNLVLIVISTIRGVGAVVVLIFVSKTIMAFLLWQLATMVLEVVFMSMMAWRMLGEAGVARDRHFDSKEIRRIGRFMAGVSGITILGAVLAQSDKLLISKLLPLEQLGYYTVAVMLASAMGRLVGPIVTAVFPRLTATYSAQDVRALVRTYTRSFGIVAFLVAPIGMALLFFSWDVLLVWTRSSTVAEHGYVALSLLGLSTMLSSMAQVPATMQFAAGMTRFLLGFNIMSFMVLLPIQYFVITHWGIVGAAASLLLFNLGLFTIVPIVTCRRYLDGRNCSEAIINTVGFMLAGALAMGGAWVIARLMDATPLISLFLGGVGLTLYYASGYLRHKNDVNKAVRSLLAGKGPARVA